VRVPACHIANEVVERDDEPLLAESARGLEEGHRLVARVVDPSEEHDVADLRPEEAKKLGLSSFDFVWARTEVHGGSIWLVIPDSSHQTMATCFDEPCLSGALQPLETMPGRVELWVLLGVLRHLICDSRQHHGRPEHEVSDNAGCGLPGVLGGDSDVNHG